MGITLIAFSQACYPGTQKAMVRSLNSDPSEGSLDPTSFYHWSVTAPFSRDGREREDWTESIHYRAMGTANTLALDDPLIQTALGTA